MFWIFIGSLSASSFVRLPVYLAVCLSVCLIFDAIICLIGSIKLSYKLIRYSADAANLRSNLNNHVDNYGRLVVRQT